MGDTLDAGATLNIVGSSTAGGVPFGEEEMPYMENSPHSLSCESSSEDDEDDKNEDNLDENCSDDKSFCTDDTNRRIMFDKSGQTVIDVMEMITAYSLKYGISHEARRDY